MNVGGKICGDDWTYVTFPAPTKPGKHLVARQPERALCMKSELQEEQEWLRGS